METAEKYLPAVMGGQGKSVGVIWLEVLGGIVWCGRDFSWSSPFVDYYFFYFAEHH